MSVCVRVLPACPLPLVPMHPEPLNWFFDLDIFADWPAGSSRSSPAVSDVCYIMRDVPDACRLQRKRDVRTSNNERQAKTVREGAGQAAVAHL